MNKLITKQGKGINCLKKQEGTYSTGDGYPFWRKDRHEDKKRAPLVPVL